MEVFRALGALIEPPASGHGELAALLGLGDPPPASLYSDLFLFQLYPYASVYVGSEGMMGGEARDRIAGFWRALDEAPPPECDHLAVMLALYARLCDFQEGAVEVQERAFWAHARRAFFWEHLASWVPVFLDKLAAMTDGYYRSWGAVLGEALGREARSLKVPDGSLLHFREAEPLADPREKGGEAFLDALLVPVRSGMILTRSDLDRAARELGVGSRAGERRFVLKALFGQDPTGILGWLGEEARQWEETHAGRAKEWQSVSSFWRESSARTRTLLSALRSTTPG